MTALDPPGFLQPQKLGRSAFIMASGASTSQRSRDEFVFRFNRRCTRQATFKTLLGIATQLKPATYNMLIKPERAR